MPGTAAALKTTAERPQAHDKRRAIVLPDEVHESVVAKSFVLVDDDYQVRAVLGPHRTEDGVFGLHVADPQGNIPVSIGLNPDNGTPFVLVKSPQGNTSIIIAIDQDSEMPFVSLNGEHAGIRMGVDSDTGQAHIGIQNADGTYSAQYPLGE
jgi:hypothetical protein